MKLQPVVPDGAGAGFVLKLMSGGFCAFIRFEISFLFNQDARDQIGREFFMYVL
jgi:hypothetical protein